VSIRVVLADDEHLVRAGLRAVLERDPGISVVAEAGDGVEAVELVRAHAPDVALIDIRMPRLDGTEATRRLAADPAMATRLVMLTTFDDDELLARALRAGALGYLLKSMPAPQLAAAVHTAAQGDVLLAPRLLQRLLAERLSQSDRTRSGEQVRSRLSARECDVMHLVAEGLSNEEIAARLVVAPATVKTHVSALLDKLGVRVRDRVQLVVLTYETGFVSPT
jgi:DNA-binding NarL/FixJ family response regulator